LNSSTASVALLELTCPLDSEYHIEAARSREQNKAEYLQLFDHLKIDNYYETVEISVLGHYQPSSTQNVKSFVDFIQPSATTKSTNQQIFDGATKICISCSQRISLAGIAVSV